MTRVKKNVPRKGDIFFDSHSGLVLVFVGINCVYDLFEFEYIGIDEVVYTYGVDLLRNLYKIKD